ncbi:Selenium-dependent molybdenum hydroxylase system protein, YqeB family [uncultured delta proteobacterium]|uniref:Selenium-dependent molybdenum hydroxylase system protein, YqeB family n=1 Tax=uncultured delta proteobacterium TaxID=34034 RepID=A0A212JBR5_9DELT|nr:Selenium-dependent molybdenum hydroxylase system protein, YqeB family [uncultured delta proteobacterium]
MKTGSCTIIIKSGGEMASGIAVRLYRAGFRNILMLETPRPLAVRRAVAFCEAVYDGEQQVEGITARRAETPGEIRELWNGGMLAVAVDPDWKLLPLLRPEMTIDAVLAKRNIGTAMSEAPLVVALGPGFTAGVDAHYVIETNRGHNLGRVYAEGGAQPNTGIPGDIGGYTTERVLRAPVDGIVAACRDIGSPIRAGETVCTVNGVPVAAAIDGIVRGCIRPGATARAGLKLGDIDPRGVVANCWTVSEKARALGGSVLEVLCAHLNR